MRPCLLLLASAASVRSLHPHELINNYLRPHRIVQGPRFSASERAAHPFFSRFASDHGLDADVLSNCTEHRMTQFLDHYNYRAAANGQTTYEQRYFVCGGAKWTPNAPIFFYTGNEANVELYVNATGLMWENADDFDAIMVFAEHRYFGESLPFGSDAADLESANIVFLSADQAMSDYAALIFALKTEWNSWDSAVIGFGGSYGGMLCSWFRLKFPQWIDGCISASAPIISFLGERPEVNANFFADGETFDCQQRGGNANDHCAENFESAWPLIFAKAESAQGRADLAKAFRLCAVPKDYDEGANVAFWVSNALGFMTMGSYPYASSYMLNGDGELPAFPMRKGCEFLKETETDEMTLLSNVRQSVAVFYNYSGAVECFDTTANANNATEIDGVLWNYLYCTEVFQTFGQNGNATEPFDMFWFAPWNATASAEGCKADYDIETRQLWAEQNFGGWLPFRAGKGSVGNIVFSNGELDPWRGGGVQGFNDSTAGISSITIPESGHHIDLFFSNANDTDAIRSARQFELEQIAKWIKQRH